MSFVLGDCISSDSSRIGLPAFGNSGKGNLQRIVRLRRKATRLASHDIAGNTATTSLGYSF